MSNDSSSVQIITTQVWLGSLALYETIDSIDVICQTRIGAHH